jgi:hypothetical protein
MGSTISQLGIAHVDTLMVAVSTFRGVVIGVVALLGLIGSVVILSFVMSAFKGTALESMDFNRFKKSSGSSYNSRFNTSYSNSRDSRF